MISPCFCSLLGKREAYKFGVNLLGKKYSLDKMLLSVCKTCESCNSRSFKDPDSLTPPPHSPRNWQQKGFVILFVCLFLFVMFFLSCV